MRSRMGPTCLLAALAFCCVGQVAKAEVVYLTIENIGTDTPMTPVFAGFHDGTYNLGTVGTTATSGLEALAELGMTAPITAEFTGGGANRVAGAASGLLMPGASATTRFDITAGGANNFLSLASMVLPSSDYFIGTVTPTGGNSPFGIDISSVTAGSPLTFDLTTIFDAGTELNDFLTSPPPDAFDFSGTAFANIPTGRDPGASAPDNPNTIRAVANPFSSFLNTPAGFTAPTDFGLRVTVSVPEPTSTIAIGSLAGLLMLRRRRKA